MFKTLCEGVFARQLRFGHFVSIYTTQTFAMTSDILKTISHRLMKFGQLDDSYRWHSNGRSTSNRFRDIPGHSSTFDLDYLWNG
jgi:hypothetical protein